MPYQVSDTGVEVGRRVAALAGGRGHRTLAEKAFSTLHDAIVSGALAPGERLLIEELAAALETSPMPIREALRRLGDVGLVQNVPHRGARVTELAVDDLAEVYDARLALETSAIEGAAEQFDEEDARTAADWLERHAKAIRRRDRTAALRAHTEFHFAVYKAAESRWLVRLISPLWESAERYRVATVGRKKGYLQSRMGEHERLLAACCDRQRAIAAAELWNHLAHSANAVAREMGAADLYDLRPVPAPERTRAR